MTKQKVLVLYGGRSTEHEISCRSAKFIFNNLDQNRYEIIPVGIAKDGAWHRQNLETVLSSQASTAPLEITNEAVDNLLLHQARSDEAIVAFPILHGSYGEDGCTQGLLELKSIAYVGPGVLGSAAAMDKVVAKTLVAAAGVPVAPGVDFRSHEWQKSSSRILAKIDETLQYPLFVKPASLGSSVGISKVESPDQLGQAIELALSYDEKVLVESGLKVREIEFGALGGYEARISQPGEVVAKSRFYSYETKYEDSSSSEVQIPAKLTEKQIREGQQLALKAFQALNLYGMSRIDLFLDEETDRFYFNEANTIPGFTNISQYPMLWQHMGLTAAELLDELIKTALDRWQLQNKLQRSYR